METKIVTIADNYFLDYSNWLQVFDSFPQLVKNSDQFKVSGTTLYGGKIAGRGISIEMSGTQNISAMSGYIYLEVKLVSDKIPTVTVKSSASKPSDSALNTMQDQLDAGNSPQSVTLSNTRNLILYYKDGSGNLTDYRNRDLMNTLYASWIYSEDSSGNKSDLQTVINDLYNTINNINVNETGYTKAEADKKFEKTVALHTHYSNSDFDDMTDFAQVINKMRTDNFSGYGATVITGACGPTAFVNVHNCVKNLLLQTFGISTNSVLSFRLEEAGMSLVGGAILQIGLDNGPSYLLSFNNYSSNYTTSDLAAFKPLGVIQGSMEIKQLLTVGEIQSPPSGIINVNGSLFLYGGDINTNNGNVELGSGNFRTNGRFYSSNKNYEQIVLEKATGTTGTKSVVLKHDTGPTAGLLSWDRSINGQNALYFNMLSLSEGTPYNGLRMVENQAPFSYGNAKFLLEAAALFATQVKNLEINISLQDQIDIMSNVQQSMLGRLNLLEAQMKAIIDGTKIPTELPQLRGAEVNNNSIIDDLKSQLAESKEQLKEQNYKDEVTLIDDQIKFLEQEIAVEKQREVEAKENEVDGRLRSLEHGEEVDEEETYDFEARTKLLEDLKLQRHEVDVEYGKE